MAISKITYAAPASITITLAGLASATARQSTAVDNTSNLYLDAMLYLAIKLATGTPAGDQAINIWFYGSEDGINYGDNASGSDNSITLRSVNNFMGPYVINTPDLGALTYKAVIPSVASMFGGIMPKKWGIIVENRTGLAFDATESNFTKEYSGITITTA